MSSQFLSLEEAAKRLGISTDRMVELRSEGKIRGFRDGASWKFPENELDRLADDLASESGAYNPYQGFGDDDQDSEDLSASAGGSGVIGGDSMRGSGLGSDVNLVASDSDGSDVMVVSGKTPDARDSDDFLISGGRGSLVEIDSGELQLSADEPVISHDSEVLDLAIEPNAGSTGPITDKELKRVANANPDLMVGKKPSPSDSGLAFDDDDDDSGDDLIGVSSDNDMLGSDLDIGGGSGVRSSGASSLELMDDLDLVGGSNSFSASKSSRGVDVLSELDLLSADAGGSGLITGDSGNVLGSSGLGIALGSGGGKRSSGNALDFDDALADDDDLVIADDEDDLVLGGSASDVSVSGDSGINLMSPSDSGLSLESEPLDLAGSSISALDLGAEIGSGIGSGSGISGAARSGRGSGINLQGDEDFRLSPSGIAFDSDGESNSQVIEIEESGAFAEEDAFGDAEFGEAVPMDSGFGDEGEQVDAFGDEAVAIDEDEMAAGPAGRRGGAAPVYEVPFSIFQVSMLVLTLFIMCLGGMLMTDLLRNMWAYTDTAAPVSSLTDALIGLANLGG